MFIHCWVDIENVVHVNSKVLFHSKEKLNYKFSRKWLEIETATVNEVNHTEKGTHYLFFLICCSKDVTISSAINEETKKIKRENEGVGEEWEI